MMNISRNSSKDLSPFVKEKRFEFKLSLKLVQIKYIKCFEDKQYPLDLHESLHIYTAVNKQNKISMSHTWPILNKRCRKKSE